MVRRQVNFSTGLAEAKPPRILDTYSRGSHNHTWLICGNADDADSSTGRPCDDPNHDFRIKSFAPRKPTMILSGLEIEKRLGEDIQIDPYCADNINPNSYNLTLHEDVMTYEEVVLDMKKNNRVRNMKIPESGLVLEPNRLYLGRDGRTHGNAQPRPDDRRALLNRQARIVCARDGWFWRRWLCWLLDVGDVRRPANQDLSWHRDLPNLLSSNRWRH